MPEKKYIRFINSDYQKLIGDFCKSSTPVQWSDSLRELRPQDWGFNLEKIKAVTQKPKKRTVHKRLSMSNAQAHRARAPPMYGRRTQVSF